MRALLLATLFAACGSTARPAPPSPAPVALSEPVPTSTAPVEPPPPAAYIDDTSGPAGAVPVPGDTPPPPLEQIDTTVTDAELAAITAWPAPKKSRNPGEVWVVLHATEDDILELGVVEHDRGVTAHYPLGKAKRVTGNDTFDGDTYPARDHTGDYEGHILFAIRVTPPGTATQDQVVVFRDGTTLRAARRPLGSKDWKAVVAVAFPKGVTFQAIGTTDPH